MPSALLHEPADVCVLPSNAVQKPGGALGLARWASGWPPRLALVGGILAGFSRAGDLRRTGDRHLDEHDARVGRAACMGAVTVGLGHRRSPRLWHRLAHQNRAGLRIDDAQEALTSTR